MMGEVGTMAAMAMAQGRVVPIATDIRVRLEVLAWRAGMRGDAQVAARLFGAVEEMTGATGAWVPLIGAEYSRSRTAAQSDLGDRLFGEAWLEGRRLSPERALAYGLARCRGEDAGAERRPVADAHDAAARRHSPRRSVHRPAPPDPGGRRGLATVSPPGGALPTVR